LEQSFTAHTLHKCQGLLCCHYPVQECAWLVYNNNKLTISQINLTPSKEAARVKARDTC